MCAGTETHADVSCRIVLSAANHSLLNCVVDSESGFRCRIVLSAANQVFAPFQFFITSLYKRCQTTN